ncbi:MAG: phytoene desaturase family protein [Acidobacteriota bacterium]
MKERSTALVIGAGFGGLAAALRLRARGFDVTIVDRQDQPGGRAAVYRRGGYTFDAGPTIITAPFLIDELFALHGRRRDDYVSLRTLEPWYRIRFHDGQTFDYSGDLETMLGEIARFSPGDVEGYRQLLQHTKKIYEIGFEQLGDQPFHQFRTMAGLVPSLARLRSDRSVYQQTARFIQHPLLRQALSFHPLLVGGNPFTTTSIYSLIHYLERSGGVHFAMGGTAALVDGFARLLSEEGVQWRLGETVEEILVDGPTGGGRRARAAGVRLASGEHLHADLVVANADAPAVYRHLVPAAHRRKWRTPKIDRMRYSMGLFVLYFGATRTYPNLAHHEILLGPRYRGLIEDIFENRVLADDMSLYLHAPTRTDASLAPAGCESMYALVPVPNLGADIDWSSAGPQLRDRLVDLLSATVCPDLDTHITEDFYVTPEHFQQRLLSERGAGFSIQPVLTQSAWFRFHNRSEELRDLYLVGAGTHPGAGVPGVLTSAKVLDRLLDEEMETPRRDRIVVPASTAVNTGANDANRQRPAARAPLATDELPAAVMARHAKTFNFAARFLPAQVRDEVAVLYRFCRFVDDLADELDDDALGLRWLDRVYDDLGRGQSDLPAVADVIALAARRNIPHEYARELIRGLRSDIGTVRFATSDELVRYCYQVASTVGVMMCRLLGARSPEAPLYAIDLGIAMQLTNIARDVREDLENDRIYLPADWVPAEQVACAVLAPGAADADAAGARVYQAVERLLTLAAEYYRSADVGMAYLPPSARWAILTASRSYEAIGDQICRQGVGYWHARAYTTTMRKAWEGTRAATFLMRRTLQSRLEAQLGQPIAAHRHQDHLHRPLIALPTAALWRLRRQSVAASPALTEAAGGELR